MGLGSLHGVGITLVEIAGEGVIVGVGVRGLEVAYMMLGLHGLRL